MRQLTKQTSLEIMRSRFITSDLVVSRCYSTITNLLRVNNKYALSHSVSPTYRVWWCVVISTQTQSANER